MDEQLNLTLNAVDKLQAFDKMLDSLNKIDSSINKLNSNIMEMGNNVRKQEGFWVKLSSQINIAKSAIGGLKTVLGGETRQSLNLVGIGSEELNKQLGILLKIKGTQEQVTKEVLKRQKAGLITDKIAARAIEETLKSRLNEKNLGEFSMKMASSSLSGAVSNFENAFNDTLKSLNFDDSPGTLVA